MDSLNPPQVSPSPALAAGSLQVFSARKSTFDSQTRPSSQSGNIYSPVIKFIPPQVSPSPALVDKSGCGIQILLLSQTRPSSQSGDIISPVIPLNSKQGSPSPAKTSSLQIRPVPKSMFNSQTRPSSQSGKDSPVIKLNPPQVSPSPALASCSGSSHAAWKTGSKKKFP